jgi:primase-polymerase (primpol)-like protein
VRIGDHQPEIDALLRKYFPEPNSNGRHKGAKSILDDEQVLEHARQAKNAAKFASLFDDGDTSTYEGDDSRADLALVGMLAFWTHDPDQIDRLFRRSALYREKWNRADYRERTIDAALNNAREMYRRDAGASEPDTSSLHSPYKGPVMMKLRAWSFSPKSEKSQKRASS